MKKAKSLLALSTGLAVLLLVAPTASAASKKNAGKDPYGINKILAKLIGNKHVSPNKHIQLDIVLKPQNQNQLTDEIYNVNTPGKPNFKEFYTPARFGQKFGQPAKVVGQYRPYFAKYHLKTQTFSNNLILKVSGSAKNVNKAFGTNLESARYHSNPVQFSTKRPKLPAKLADNVLTVLGITSLNVKASVLAKKSAKKAAKPVAKYAPSKFTNRYQLSPLYNQGFKGQGQTVGIVSFAGFDKANAEHFWKAEHIATKPNRISIKNIASPSVQATNDKTSQFETTVDVEQAGAVAPQANIRLYHANFSDVGMVNSFATAFDENKVGSLSMSWGINEYMLHYYKNNHLLSPVYGQVMNLVMAQGALQGISTFIASGDSGALAQGVGGKIGPIKIPNYSTYAFFPADNPWVTATGGTTIPFSRKIKKGVSVSVNKERAWGGDYLFNAYTKGRNELLNNIKLFSLATAGGGGGISHLYNTPQYQEGVSGVNTFNARQYISNLMQPRMNPVLLSGTDYGRNYPDVSANADPLTGYQVYDKAMKGWSVQGGTSFVAPQFNGATAVMNSGKGQRMGLWNAQIYQLAQDKDKTPFTVMDSNTNNSNLYYTGQPGKLYNQATGLGTVNFQKLYDNYQ